MLNFTRSLFRRLPIPEKIKNKIREKVRPQVQKAVNGRVDIYMSKDKYPKVINPIKK